MPPGAGGGSGIGGEGQHREARKHQLPDAVSWQERHQLAACEARRGGGKGPLEQGPAKDDARWWRIYLY